MGRVIHELRTLGARLLKHFEFVDEAELKVNTLAYLAQHLVVLLDESAIVSGLQVAYTHPVLQTARYAVFHTGPSATADIEGVLIHGAQGVRSLTVIVDG